MMPESKTRIIVGITGASGSIYAVKLLEQLKALRVETHLVMSSAARRVIPMETGITPETVAAMADFQYSPEDIAAAISSGSFRTAGMVIIPCSMRSMSEIACGVTSSLLTRAADVVLKEHRRLVLVVRETPLHLGHLRSMTALAEMGAIIAPPVPAMYTRPQTIDDIVLQTVGRVLDLLGIESEQTIRWNGTSVSN
jgi:4-hydroxy-3-polyprenylbenzoate decarboxylase